MNHLHSLHPNNEGELGYDVQNDPTHLDDQVVRDDTKSLNTQTEPNREREPGDDQQDGEFAEVRISLKDRFLILGVLFDLHGVVPEHDEGQEKTKCIPGITQSISCEHRCRSTEEDGHRQQWHHETSIAWHTRTCKYDQLQLHDGAGGNPFDWPGQVQGEIVLTPWQIKVINRSELQNVEETRKECHRRTDGSTHRMTLFQRCLLSNSHLGIVCKDQPHRKADKTHTLTNLRDIVCIIEVNLVTTGTICFLHATKVCHHILNGGQRLGKSILFKRHSRRHDSQLGCYFGKAGLATERWHA
mmetsp:Transcript_10370/g.14554  ORF Transcript_10370/g.14554 Transcript_10370/m.14554 type:complete len:300 (+) Transcript_10370:808-1707(+)